MRQNVRRDEEVPDEELHLRRNFYNPKVVDRLEEFSTEEEIKENREWLKNYEKELKKNPVIEK